MQRAVLDVCFRFAAPKVCGPVFKTIREVAVADQIATAVQNARAEIFVLDKVRNHARILNAERTVDANFLAPADESVVRAMGRHVHFRTVEVARAPAPSKPSDV